ncbi:MAG: peptide chain release factor N(5)-glutamine methyltransferase, partial [Verrucomicrobiota bacterium]
MPTILEIIQKTADFFATKGVESPRLNAETLVGHALGLKRMQLYLQFERPLADADLDRIRPLVKRRAMREPLQHILGTVEWAGLVLKCDRRALIPRPETEYLVELLSARLADGPPATILDLGTGTGALACALATTYPSAAVTAVDLSEEALALATENVAALGLTERVRLLRSDWFAGLAAGETFDLIVANPPYLAEEETAESEPEVRRFEPLTALTAAESG